MNFSGCLEKPKHVQISKVKKGTLRGITCSSKLWVDVPTNSSSIAMTVSLFFRIAHRYFPLSLGCTLDITNDRFPLWSSSLMRFVLYRKTGFFISKVSNPSRYRKANADRSSLLHSTVGTSWLAVVLQDRRTVSPAEATIFGTLFAEAAVPVKRKRYKTWSRSLLSFKKSYPNTFYLCSNNIISLLITQTFLFNLKHVHL